VDVVLQVSARLCSFPSAISPSHVEEPERISAASAPGQRAVTYTRPSHPSRCRSWASTGSFGLLNLSNLTQEMAAADEMSEPWPLNEVNHVANHLGPKRAMTDTAACRSSIPPLWAC
jgi:hypothetical protein